MKAKKYLNTIIITLLTVFIASASGTDKHLIYRSIGDDMIVFIKPRKMAKAKNSMAVKPLEYDITLNNKLDSITVTYTIVTKSDNLKVDSVSINDSMRFANERLYIEQKSNKWIYRLKFKLPNSDFYNTFCSDRQLNLTVDNCDFEISKKKQVKESAICRSALNLIELNKK